MSEIKYENINKISASPASAKDIVHYGKVVSALGETIRIMKEVDTVIESAGGWAIK